jgi:hypothetical protein
MNSEFNKDEELQYREQVFSSKQYSLELVQKLTYFIITIELVGCGYVLLTADKLIEIRNLNYLFLICGVSALMGLFWRFFYNQVHFNHSFGINNCIHKVVVKLQFIAYYLYVVCSITSLIWFLILGFEYLSNISTGS